MTAPSIHVSHSEDPFIVWSLKGTNAFAWSKRQVRRAQVMIGRMWTSFIMLLCTPFIVVLYVVTVYASWRLMAFARRPIVLDLKNYDKLYRRNVELKKMSGEVESLINTRPQGAPLVIRPFIHQLVAMLRAIDLYQKRLTQTFDRLDQPCTPLPEGMRILTTEELAVSRPKGYEYLA